LSVSAQRPSIYLVLLSAHAVRRVHRWGGVVGFGFGFRFFFCIPTQTSFYIGSEVLYFCVVLLAIFVRFLPFVYALHAMHNTNKKKNKGKLFVASVVPLHHPKKKIYIGKKTME